MSFNNRPLQKSLPGLLLALSFFCSAQTGQTDEPPDRARQLHQKCLVIDGHNDLPWAMREKAASSFKQADIAEPQPQFHTDIPRLKQGNVGAQFWSAYVPSETQKERRSAHYTLEQIDLIHRMIKR